MLFFIVLTMSFLFFLDLNSTEQKYNAAGGWFIVFIQSYRLALGDFEIAGDFEDNSEYMLTFWLIFIAGTMICLLIILNMIIAVMSETFTRVEEENVAHMYREKLIAILDKIHLFDKATINKFAEQRYLLLVEVDPETDVMPNETEETHIKSAIGTLKDSLNWMKMSQLSLSNRLISLHERVTSFEKRLDEDSSS